MAGEEIPLSARLMSVADVYDALRSPRVYKPPMTHEAAREIIISGKGAQFAPDVVDAFIACENEFQEIEKSNSDLNTEAG